MMDFIALISKIAIAAVPVLLAITFHEASHGYVAYRLGDPTAKLMGRLTLNPLSHIHPIGTIVMPIMLFVLTNGKFVFGYAKPVPVDPRNFKNPQRDMALSALCGPVANIMLAVVSVLLLKYAITPLSQVVPQGMLPTVMKPVALMLKESLTFNVLLAVFNLIPVPPLDGGKVLMGVLPYRWAYQLSKLENFGMIIVMLLVVTGIASYIIIPIVHFIEAILELL